MENYGSLLVQSRNLEFFTSFYRYLIQLLPAAVVAPLYFKVAAMPDEGGERVQLSDRRNP